MSANDKQTATDALHRIRSLEDGLHRLEAENRTLKARVDNLERILQGRLNQPAATPQVRRTGVVIAGAPPRPAPLPGVAPAPTDKPPDPPKAA